MKYGTNYGFFLKVISLFARDKENNLVKRQFENSLIKIASYLGKWNNKPVYIQKQSHKYPEHPKTFHYSYIWKFFFSPRIVSRVTSEIEIF